MIFALQDEPERGRRWTILGLGAIVAVAVWGGGIFAASRYQPDEKPKQVAIVVKLVKPKPKPPEPKPEAPKTEAPATLPPPPPPTEPPPPPPKPKPKPKPEPRPKPEPKPKPEPPKPPPATPTTAPPRPAPVQLGMTYGMDDRGKGPAVQQGNQFGGGKGGEAKKPVNEPPPGGDRVQEGPAPDPVRTAATVKKKVRPEYTRAALRAGIEGKVVVVARIDPEGKVTDVKLIKGLGYGLDEVAVEAVKKWLFSPATLDGKAIASSKRIDVDFVIED